MPFATRLGAMDSAILSSLSDGCIDHLSASKTLLAGGLEAIVDTDVQRINEVTGFVDRVVTVCVRKASLGNYARNGLIRSNAAEPVAALGSKDWHIDGVAADDGSLITFYVVP